MLLTLLHETITKRARTTEELQKQLDVAGCQGIVATGPTTVKVKGSTAKLTGIITAGTLQFSFEANEEPIKTMHVDLGTVTSLKGLEKLTVDTLTVQKYTKTTGSVVTTSVHKSKLTSLEGCPLITETLSIHGATELKSLKGLRFHEDAISTTLGLTDLPKLESLIGADNVGNITMSSCNAITLKGFPKTCVRLDISYNKLTKQFPWFIMIPSTCAVKVDARTFDDDLPQEILAKMVKLQKAGATRRDMLDIQQEMIDAGMSDVQTEI